ncbi:MAG: hypothetical protein WD208_06180 [Dehalococcoidia bacterium]
MDKPAENRELTVTLFVLFGLSAVYGYFLAQNWFIEAYDWLWMNTTERPFTLIIRENPWLFGLPAGIAIVLTFVHFPHRYWARALIIYHTFLLGFIAGHAFWP